MRHKWSKYRQPTGQKLVSTLPVYHPNLQNVPTLHSTPAQKPLLQPQPKILSAQQKILNYSLGLYPHHPKERALWNRVVSHEAMKQSLFHPDQQARLTEWLSDLSTSDQLQYKLLKDALVLYAKDHLLPKNMQKPQDAVSFIDAFLNRYAKDRGGKTNVSLPDLLQTMNHLRGSVLINNGQVKYTGILLDIMQSAKLVPAAKTTKPGGHVKAPLAQPDPSQIKPSDANPVVPKSALRSFESNPLKTPEERYRAPFADLSAEQIKPQKPFVFVPQPARQEGTILAKPLPSIKPDSDEGNDKVDAHRKPVMSSSQKDESGEVEDKIKIIFPNEIKKIVKRYKNKLTEEQQIKVEEALENGTEKFLSRYILDILGVSWRKLKILTDRHNLLGLINDIPVNEIDQENLSISELGAPQTKIEDLVEVLDPSIEETLKVILLKKAGVMRRSLKGDLAHLTNHQWLAYQLNNKAIRIKKKPIREAGFVFKPNQLAILELLWQGFSLKEVESKTGLVANNVLRNLMDQKRASNWIKAMVLYKSYFEGKSLENIVPARLTIATLRKKFLQLPEKRREVGFLLASNYTRSKIAVKMSVHENTVFNEINHIKEALLITDVSNDVFIAILKKIFK